MTLFNAMTCENCKKNFGPAIAQWQIRHAAMMACIEHPEDVSSGEWGALLVSEMTQSNLLLLSLLRWSAKIHSSNNTHNLSGRTST